MPTYQYRCAACQNQFDAFQRFADDPLTDCPACAGSVRRVIQPVGVVFKGSGWYINDSRKKTESSSSSETTTTKTESPKPETVSGEKVPAETKSATATATATVEKPAAAAAD